MRLKLTPPQKPLACGGFLFAIGGFLLTPGELVPIKWKRTLYHGQSSLSAWVTVRPRNIYVSLGTSDRLYPVFARGGRWGISLKYYVSGTGIKPLLFSNLLH